MPCEWTIYVCPVCAYMDPDQHVLEGQVRTCPFAVRGGAGGTGEKHPYDHDPAWDPNVEFVPVIVTLSSLPEASDAA